MDGACDLSPMKRGIPEGMEKNAYYVCRDCGARYSSASSYPKSQHTKINGHSGFIRKTEIREKKPMEATYLHEEDRPRE